jgi:hypothetical protein
MGRTYKANSLYLFCMPDSTYKKVFTPDGNNHSVDIPKRFYGKKIQIIVQEIDNVSFGNAPIPPPGKKVSVTGLFKYFGEAPSFPPAEEIRAKAWPSKW